MLTLHHLENSRSHRILWLLEELGVPYELAQYRRDKRTMLAPPELKAIYPLGKSPIVTDGDTVLAESGHIVETLIERYGPHLAPPRDTAAFLQYRYWLHYAEGSAMPPLLLKLISGKIATAPVPFFVRPIVKTIAKKLDTGFIDAQLKLHFDHIESHLAGRDFFAGDALSGADIMMFYPVEAGAGRVGALETRKNLARWLAAMRARPALVRALAKGGPLSFDL